MATPKAITVRWLKRRYACADQIKQFRLVFGNQAELTRTNALLAASAGLDMDWLASRLLSVTAQRTYAEAVATAQHTYAEAVATARRTYAEAVATAQHTYAEAVATARRTYAEAVATARRTYDEAVVTARRTYAEAAAEALCDQLGFPEEE